MRGAGRFLRKGPVFNIFLPLNLIFPDGNWVASAFLKRGRAASLSARFSGRSHGIALKMRGILRLVACRGHDAAGPPMLFYENNS